MVNILMTDESLVTRVEGGNQPGTPHRHYCVIVLLPWPRISVDPKTGPVSADGESILTLLTAENHWRPANLRYVRHVALFMS